MRTITRSFISFSVLASIASAAHATGYYVMTYQRSPGTGEAVVFQGFSTTSLSRFSLGISTDQPFGALADFNGDLVPELVTADNQVPGVNVWDINTKANLAAFSFGLGNTGGPITLNPPNIHVAATIVNPGADPTGGTGNFTYAPGGTPTPANPFLDLDGDGVADSVAFNPSNVHIELTNGATHAVTSFFPNFLSTPLNVTFNTWTPLEAPEPASLATLALGIATLCCRRRRC